MKVILKKPVMTEKSLVLAKRGEYTFWVDRGAGKKEIASAVEELFGVKVVRVRSVTVRGKIRRKGKKKQPVLVRGGKKAMVKVGEGEKIDLFSEFVEEKKGK